MRVKVCVAIVTYNSAPHIEACIASLHSRSAQLEVVVYDNASNDHSAALAERCLSDGTAPPHGTVLRSSRNIGFAAAVNAALKGRVCDYVLLLNPDVVLDSDALDRLIALAEENSSKGIWGGRMTRPDGSLDPSSCLAAPTVWQAIGFGIGLGFLGPLRPFDPDSLGGWARTGTREVPVLTGALLLIRHKLWMDTGGFDDRFFMYGEDVDFCMRARTLGAQPTFSDQVRYTHVGRASSTSRADYLVLLLKGKVTIYDLHLRHGLAGVGCRMLLCGAALRAVLEAFFRPTQTPWRAVWQRRAEWRSGWLANP